MIPPTERCVVRGLKLRSLAQHVVLLVSLLPCTGAGAQETRPATKRTCLQAMEDVSRVFLDLERDVGQRRDAVAPGARLLATHAREIPELEPAAAAAERAGFAAARARLVTLAEELAACSTDADERASAIALQRLRLGCVSCHVQFRDAGGDAFPARRNTIWGRVKLETLDGVPRQDREDVVLFLDLVADRAAPPPAAIHPSMSQKGQQFLPRVLPVVQSTEVRFPNDDTVFHNVFSVSKPKPFDLGVYHQGATRSVVFPETGLVRVFCNIHPQMTASILILDNPWFAVTDHGGVFVITDVPDGTYSFRAWHEMGGGDTRPVTIAGGVVSQIDPVIRETSRVLQPHKNKFGLPYRGKYR